MQKLKEGNYYHIYNRGINSTDLFLENSDFNFFLQEYFYYSHLSLKTYAYCLMKNHFHLLVKINSVKEQKALFTSYRKKLQSDKNQWLPHGCNFNKFKPQLASRQFAHLFSKYTKNFNKWNNRTGKLFEQPFKRKQVKDESYLTHLICYIHRNPIHHGIVDDYKSYPHSSFQVFVSSSDMLLQKREVLAWFGGKQQFKDAHQEMKIQAISHLQINP